MSSERLNDNLYWRVLGASARRGADAAGSANKMKRFPAGRMANGSFSNWENFSSITNAAATKHDINYIGDWF